MILDFKTPDRARAAVPHIRACHLGPYSESRPARRVPGPEIPGTCLLSDLLILGKTGDHLHVLISELTHCYFVVLLGNMVGQDDSGKDWKTIGGVKRAIIVIVVNAGQLLGRGSHKSEGATRGPEPRKGPHPCFPYLHPKLQTK